MSDYFNESGHLTLASLIAFKNGTLTDDERLSVAGHISDCQSCASILADSYSESELAEVPSGFVEEVAGKLPQGQITRRQLTFYSIRVAVAACAALVIIAFGTSNFVTDLNSKASKINKPDLSIVDSINTGIQNFSKNIMNLEVFKNEKEKK